MQDCYKTLTILTCLQPTFLLRCNYGVVLEKKDDQGLRVRSEGDRSRENSGAHGKRMWGKEITNKEEARKEINVTLIWLHLCLLFFMPRL